MLSRAVWMNRFPLLDEYLTSPRSHHWELSLSLSSLSLLPPWVATKPKQSTPLLPALPAQSLTLLWPWPWRCQHHRGTSPPSPSSSSLLFFCADPLFAVKKRHLLGLFRDTNPTYCNRVSSIFPLSIAASLHILSRITRICSGFRSLLCLETVGLFTMESHIATLLP